MKTEKDEKPKEKQPEYVIIIVKVQNDTEEDTLEMIESDLSFTKDVWQKIKDINYYYQD